MTEIIRDITMAVAVTSGLWYLLLLAMSKLHENERQQLRQEVTELKGEIVDLKARVRPFNYELRADGVNVIVERGRLDLPEPRESAPSTVSTINLTEFGDDGLPT